MSRAGSVDTSTVDNYHVIELVGEGSFGKVRARRAPHAAPARRARTGGLHRMHLDALSWTDCAGGVPVACEVGRSAL